MATFISHSPAETEALGEAWGREAAAGWLIGLSGPLGAGKTQLVKGLAHGLGIGGRVHSPTFTLIHEYAGGRLPLAHLDLFRLDSPAQILGAGLEPYLLQPPGVTVVEWIERWPEWSDASFHCGKLRRVRVELLDEQQRRIVYEDSGG
jgi:tRNA threonylcarbamoyladenosine biosynthesis protein TsaE